MKQLLFPLFLICSILIGSGLDVYATHILGAEISYSCVDSCTYRIYVNNYYDCGGFGISSFVPIDTVNPNPPGFTNPMNFITGIPNSPGQGCTSPIALGSWTLETYEEVTQLCPTVVSNCFDPNATLFGVHGVALVSYYRDYDFCNTDCDQYDISWANCCRSAIITSTGLSNALVLSGVSIYPDTICNGSPSFLEDPSVTICQHAPTSISQGAIDQEGDSLVYSLTNCLSQPSQPVSYLPGYGAQAPLGPHWAVNLDPATGWLTFVPDSLASLEVGVMCIRVDEYRNGNLIGSITRDIQVTILACDTSGQPVIGDIQLLNGGQGISYDTLEACPGIPLHFEIVSYDPDVSQTLTLVHGLNQTLPSAQVNISGSNPIVLEVMWTPDSSDANRVIELLLGVYDESCPYPMYSMSSNFISVSDSCVGALTTDTACNDSTGVIDLIVWGGIPPYTYQWNTGAMTEDLSNLIPGTYWVDIWDGTGGLLHTDTFFINSTDILLNPIFLSPDCDGNGGEIELIPSGGLMPYSFQWNTGSQNNQITGLSPGGYSVLVEDANACPKQEVFFLDSPDSCFVEVSGKAYYDLNMNCTQDPGELGIPYLFIELSPGYSTFTDVNGNYSIQVDTGSYILKAQPTSGSYLQPICPFNGEHILNLSTYNADSSGLDFAMKLIPVQDLQITGSLLSAASPGISYLYWIHIYNTGNFSLNATVEVKLDSLMIYGGSNFGPMTYDPVTHTVSWQIHPMIPGHAQGIKIYGIIDTTASIGNNLSILSQISPIVGDSTPLNNVFLDTGIVLGPYDPNDKQVRPAGFGEEGFIQAHENEMRYTIRFQNVGNFPAQYVVIRDTVHPNLDLRTYRPKTHSHVYSLNVEEDSILVFTFANINLPDSASDPTGSQGMVSFSLEHNGTLSLGDQITNSAAIYFDFNEPIITNEVLNTIYSPMSVAFDLDSVLCEGEDIHAHLLQQGLPPFHYSWNDGAGMSSADSSSSFAIDSSGVYRLRVVDALGIEMLDSVYVEVLPTPVAMATTDIQGLTVQFMDSSSHSQSRWWDFGDGTGSADLAPVHTYTSEGPYQAQLFVNNPCGSDITDIPVFLTTSIEDEFQRSVQIIPNPFSLQTTIQFANPNKEPFTLTVLNLQGQIVWELRNLSSEETVFHRDDLSQGIYLFHLSGNEKYYSGKLLIK
ncbi:MAG: PKD domain-containing protein [Bacteroidota bacterium]